MKHTKAKAIGFAAGTFLLLAVSTAWMPGLRGDKPTLTVYKSQWCGCCSLWATHMQENGFEVKVIEANDLAPVKSRYGVSPELGSCHTAIVDGYVVEGHVPADLVHRLLEERPDVIGLAVPGMPIGSPGMEGPGKENYDVLTFDREGNTTVYARR